MREHAVRWAPEGTLPGAAGVCRTQDTRPAAGRHGGRGAVGRAVLTPEQRLAVDRVTAIGVRWTLGGSCDLLRAAVVAELHAVTRDGVVLGVARGMALAVAESDGWRPYHTLAQLYRDAGADERVAAAELAWLREHNGASGSRAGTAAGHEEA